jgi:hypothetical protein
MSSRRAAAALVLLVTWATLAHPAPAATDDDCSQAGALAQARFDAVVARMNLEVNKLRVAHFTDALGNRVRGLQATQNIEMGASVCPRG